MKRFFSGLATVLLLALGLGAWIVLPWPLVLALVAAIALWLLTTRSGRLAREATKIGIAGLPQRWGASSVIVIGIAGVVGVLVAMLAMGEGFKATLDKTGDTNTAILLRAGSQAETNSVITRDQVSLITALPGIARGTDGKALASPKVWKGETDVVQVGVAQPLLVSTPRGKYDRLKATMELPTALVAPIAKGQKLGTVKVALDGKVIAQAPLVAVTAVEEGGFFKRLWHELLMWWQS